LANVVRRALVGSRRAHFGIAMFAAGLSAGTAAAASFPAVFDLSSLRPGNGGDGSNGFVLLGVDSSDHSGHSVSRAGDMNGDGIDDLIVGANPGRPAAGESYVLFGKSTGFPAALALSTLFPGGGGDGSSGFVLTGSNIGDYAGFSVSNGGDLNGDGMDDVIIGAPKASPNGEVYAGESYLVFGRRTPFPAAFSLSRLFPGAGGDGSEGFVLKGFDFVNQAGWSVSNAGDVNGDGITDVIVGAPNAEARNGRGRVGDSYVVFGRTEGFPPVFQLASLLSGDGSAGFVIKGVANPDTVGYAVAGAGDINGDGIDDVIVGSRWPNNRAGGSYVVFGRNNGFPAVLQLASLLPGRGGDGTVGFELEGVEDFDESGEALSGAGDVNGDGVDDLIIGARQADNNNGADTGESYVVFGRRPASRPSLHWPACSPPQEATVATGSC
jgi:hypothetical protein